MDDPKQEPKTTTKQPDKTDADGGGDGQGQPAPAVTFTQEQLDAIVKDRLERAKTATTTGLLTELGIDNLDTAKKTLADAEAAREAQMSELEKAQAAIVEAQAQAAKAATEAEAVKAQADEALLKAAIISKAGDFNDPLDAWSFIDRTKVEVQDDGTYKGVDEALKALAEAKPYLVKTDANAPPRPGTPGRPRPQSIIEKLLDQSSRPEEPVRPKINF